MPNPIARESKVAVGRVFTPRNAAALKKLLDLGSCDSDHRPEESVVSDRQDPGKTRQARSPQQAKQNRFGLIVPRVPERHSIHDAFRHQIQKKCASGAAGILLEIPFECAHLCFGAIKPKIEPMRQIRDEGFIGIGLRAAKLMIEMQDREPGLKPRRQLFETQKQTDRILAARHRYT